MAKHTRKGRNPGPVDEWLDTLGYYRKNVAYDETCMFRAVSEQVFACQLFHERIRKECITYATERHHEFRHLMGEDDWRVYLGRLTNHMAVCGDVEIQIICRTYRKNIRVFDGLHRRIRDVSCSDAEDFLLLCHMGEDHYDVVYRRDYIQESGFCQSIVYNMLYENVFSIPKVTNIYQAMLYHKAPTGTVEYVGDGNNNKRSETDVDPVFSMESLRIDESHRRDDVDAELGDYEYMLKTNIAPFPFKVAKALDPTIYRNIEYDTWTEMRKEMRLGDWYYGDNNFIPGSACVLKDRGEELPCYIQEILKHENKCVIYITSRAEKRIVDMCVLQPEADAKPWPLPYRFSKNLTVTLPKLDLPDRKALRKKRDKKRTVSKESNDSGSQTETPDAIVSSFEGAPLQMQQSDLGVYDHKGEATVVTPPQISFGYGDGIWDGPSSAAVPQTPEPVIWPQTPTTPQTYSAKMVVPTTPEIYSDQRYFYSPENDPRYNVWTNGDYPSPTVSTNQVVPASPQSAAEVVPQSPDGYSYYFGEYYSPPTYYATNNYTPVQSPQVELYQPVYPVPPPGTPILVTPTEVTEYVVPAPHVAVYTPTVEVPYVATSPFVYPTTPQPAWYHPAVNPQGFIFPTINAAPAHQLK